jgi:hypothetical protein
LENIWRDVKNLLHSFLLCWDVWTSGLPFFHIRYEAGPHLNQATMQGSFHARSPPRPSPTAVPWDLGTHNVNMKITNTSVDH